MRPNIFVIGYPRSGTTWLCRLIADAWNCPIGSVHSPEIFHGHATEGRNRQGSFVIRHGHKSPGELRTNFVDGDYVIFIYRDPRDVIVSQSHYFDRSLDKCINDAINGRLGAEGPLRFPIAEYVNTWLKSGLADYAVRYEYLHTDATLILYDISGVLQTEPINDLAEVVRRQSFLQRKEWTEQHSNELTFGKEYHLRFMRKGIIGDWENHFTPEQQQRVENGMDGLGYW